MHNRQTETAHSSVTIVVHYPFRLGLKERMGFSPLLFSPFWILHLNKVHLKFNNDDVSYILHKVSKCAAFLKGAG